jgi:NAD(P)-dependent dehydrogenase (short-subunit alcohol dehydrogenase family)
MGGKERVVDECFNLQGEVAIVTGGSQGLGKEIAKALAQNGATVVIASRNLEKLETVAREIREAGGRAEAIQCDISQSASVQNLVNRVIDRYSQIDILINNAGMNFPPKPLVDFPEEEWQRVIDTNLKGTFFCCKAVCPHMMKRKKGRVINIASIAGSVGFPGMGPYGAAKAGMIQLTKTLALELAEHNINVNAIAPGFFDTPLRDNIRNNKKVIDFTIERTPLRRCGQPQELKGLILLLSSGASSYITGQTIFIDGGWTVW